MPYDSVEYGRYMDQLEGFPTSCTKSLHYKGTSILIIVNNKRPHKLIIVYKSPG
jgi:hypothetical protein